MKRVKSHAQWNKLSPEQLKQVDQWLFTEKLRYDEVFKRAKAELGFEGSESSIKRYSLRRQKELTFERFENLQDNLVALSNAPADPKEIHAGAAKLMEGYLFQQLQESPDDVEQWGPVARLLMQNNFTEMLREAKANEHKIRHEAMAFAKEKFEFDVVEKALKALPELRELEEARKDPRIKRYEENARWNRVRRALLGADAKLRPESAEEEAQMLATKKEFQAPNLEAAEKLQNDE